uniref:DUF7927 domain-containing protein n=1 Tax=Herbidospora sakaeratensis TaxID=564415 RepID=UPI000A06BB1D|nr:isopeptide-forming domain-containing fimbrial protein [Herbidospora sakaeratensis]
MLDIAETVTPDPAKAGQKVTYTITATNTGGVALSPATLNDDLSKVLDKAAYNNDLTATVGTASIAGTMQNWAGNLPVNAQAKITFSVTTHLDSGGQTLHLLDRRGRLRRDPHAGVLDPAPRRPGRPAAVRAVGADLARPAVADHHGHQPAPADQPVQGG